MNQENTRKYNHYLYDLILHLKTNAKKFSESLGHTRTDRIYNVLKGINKLSPDLANEIINVYPEVEYTWLITGDGQMLKNVLEKVDNFSLLSGIVNRPHDEQMGMLYGKISEIDVKISTSSAVLSKGQELQEKDFKLFKAKYNKQEKLIQEQAKDIKEIKEMLIALLKTKTT